MHETLRALCLIGIACLAQVAVAADPANPVPVRPPGDEPAEILADRVEYDRARELYTAEGNVRLSQGRRTLTADWVTFNNVSRQGVASGDVVVIDGPDTMRADFMEFNVDTLDGVVFRGRIDGRTTPFKMSGSEIQSFGEERYRFQDAVFSACKCPDAEDTDPWQIRARQADLDADGYGRARNTTFEILGIPVFYFPYLRYPIKRERETGFLFPLFGRTSRSGIQVGLPFFWAAREDLNVIFTPEWLQFRGFKPSIDAEYLFGREGRSQLHVSYIYDKEVEPDTYQTPFGQNRWAVRWAHDQWLPAETRFQADVNLVSDNNYTFDFQDMEAFRNDRFLVSQAIVTKNFGPTGRFGLVGSAVYRDDLQNPDDRDRDRLAQQRLPDVSLSVLPGSITEELPLLASLGAQYTFFDAFSNANKVFGGARNVDNLFIDTGIDGVPDARERDALGQFGGVDSALDNFPLGPEADGAFGEGEILANAGHRLLLHPRLGYPLRLFDFLELLPEVGYRETVYRTTALGTNNRGYVTGRVDLRTRLRRSLELPFGIGAATHLLEPRIGYAHVSTGVVAKTPIFIPQTAFEQQRIRELDLDNVVLDPADRLQSRDVLAGGLGNRIYGKGIGGAAPRLLADFTVLGQYDFATSRAGSLVLDGTAYPGANIYTRFIMGYQMQEQRFDEALLQASWGSPSGDDISISYRFLDSIPLFPEAFFSDPERFGQSSTAFSQVNQVGVYLRWAITRNWGLTYNATYSADQSVFLGNQGGIEYLSKCRCWALRVEINEDPVTGVAFGVRYRIVGLGDDTVRPFSGFTGGLLPTSQGGGIF